MMPYASGCCKGSKLLVDSTSHTDNYPMYISYNTRDHTPADYDTSHPLTALILNCQSLTAKKESFQKIICTHSPDVIFGTESWLKSTVKNS